MNNKIRIAGASGYWGDSNMATAQFLTGTKPDYIIYDFLAEITMSIMARARAAKPEMGYATDFITGALKPNLADIAAQGIKVISNAGGVNPLACAKAAQDLIAEQGLNLKVAVITGDDVITQKQILEKSGVKDMFSGATFPPEKDIVSMNAYLGAFPIASALADGADIVITGRCVDSAVTLAACIYEFGWKNDDYDLLAAGSLAGHIIECGPQVTGGNFTDWRQVADIDQIGYPYIDISDKGDFDVSKPNDTGGLVSKGTVSEQMLYEIGNPQAYELPDVCCDFSKVEITQIKADIVRVSKSKGYPPSQNYKVSATYLEGFRAGIMLSFIGLESRQKAEHFANMTLERTRKILRERNLADYTETSIEILGADSQFGDYASKQEQREVVLKMAIKHPEQKAASMFLKETNGMSLATPPGLAVFAGSRPKPSPVVRLFSFLIDKKSVPVQIHLDGKTHDFSLGLTHGKVSPPVEISPPEMAEQAAKMVAVPLVKLAWGRSGDKGNKVNIGIIARHDAYMPYIWQALDAQVVRARFAHFIDMEDTKEAVERYYLPGSHAINFLIDETLGGGGTASLRNDPQGKSFAQILLDHPISIPTHIAKTL